MLFDRCVQRSYCLREDVNSSYTQLLIRLKILLELSCKYVEVDNIQADQVETLLSHHISTRPHHFGVQALCQLSQLVYDLVDKYLGVIGVKRWENNYIKVTVRF